MTTVLLDAYDSFTFNLYQYLNQAGATDVQVFRNDKITLDEVIALQPRNIVLSPGPGHPREDPGICYEVLAHFQGKIPILGVCLGQQMMYEHYGGTVGSAGEIHHGKTSAVTHDGQGLYSGLAQRFPITRYHSLSGDPRTLPDCLEITSWTDSGVVMGVRHKVFAVEGVQYHPESILSENGHAMLRAFLQLRGGTWAENPGMRDHAPAAAKYPGPGAAAGSEAAAAAAESEAGGILGQIFRRRQQDVAAQKAAPGRSLADVERAAQAAGPPLVDFAARLRAAASGGRLAVVGEIKRASPSRGHIADAVAAEAAAEYARAGAAAVSVLTEPHWFRGSLDDLRDARQALAGIEGRPAVLRKEFIFDRYQIAEARLAGADSVLLIVKMLAPAVLCDLLAYSRSLDMEPLVEVNTADEMRAALDAGARVVGVNNRDLRTFDVDIATTSALAAAVPAAVVLVALSGITGPQDAATYRGTPVSALLVGEALMRAADKRSFVESLQHA
ncbi:anthranilate synthase / indole-3-glycerol phosphate synthase [Coemansia javaensis]|uniref:Multifunctional tryptophan biosynthesis protein n=1 Tax=Coemansia javaensis TaxID=2761396 RepID=A0A9W8H9S6_9FUNG|nr:anthranilate synthase / indole-3-glycerol phosphate synthase [Coemansia javaensis]